MSDTSLRAHPCPADPRRTPWPRRPTPFAAAPTPSTSTSTFDDAATDGTGVIDLNARMRPAGGRRSSRHTHTRLVAALARIQANSLAAHSDLAAAAPAPLGCGTDR